MSKKRLISLIFLVCFSLVFASVTGFAVPDNSNIKKLDGGAELVKIAQIPVGEGNDKVQVLTNVEGSIPLGPQSLDVDINGEIYLLDSIQSRVVVLKNGKILKNIDISFACYPRDILINNKHLFILDSNAVVYESNLEGQIINTYDLPEGVGSVYFSRFIENNGEVELQSVELEQVPLSALKSVRKDELGGKESKYKGYKNIDGTKLKSEIAGLRKGVITSIDTSSKIEIETEQAFGSVNIMGSDNSGKVYVVVEELVDPSPVIATEVTLRCYNKKGEMRGVVKLPIDEFASYPNRAVDITKDGKVYLMVPSEDVVTLYSAKLGNSYKSDLKEKREKIWKKYKEESSVTPLGTYVGNPYSRATTRSRAYAMADYTWTWNPTQFDYLPKDGSFRNSAYAPRPAQLSSSSSHSTTGIPYLWGGWDSQYSRTDGSPWNTFAAALVYYKNQSPTKRGPLVGDINSANDPKMGGTAPKYYPYLFGNGAGIDCSGFVASATGVYDFTKSKPGTDHMRLQHGTNIVSKIGNNNGHSSFSEVQPMDYFVNSSHVLMYDYRAFNGTGFYTIESTTGQGAISGSNMQGAKRYFYTWSSLNNYTPKTWWTTNTGDSFTKPFTSTGSYSCIRGQSQYFKFTFTSSSARTISVTTNASSGDPDVYVYDSNYRLIGSSRLGAIDTVSWVGAPNATYYVQVYGYSENNSSYSISLQF